MGSRGNLALVASGEPERCACIDPARRGYHVVYRANQPNYCPGCGRSQWYVGRTMAECAFCETAIPLHEVAL